MATTSSNLVTCDGCGHYHGSVNAEMMCLREQLSSARGRAHKAEETIRAMKRPAREYHRSVGWPYCDRCEKPIERGSTKFADPCRCSGRRP